MIRVVGTCIESEQGYIKECSNIEHEWETTTR